MKFLLLLPILFMTVKSCYIFSEEPVMSQDQASKYCLNKTNGNDVCKAPVSLTDALKTTVKTIDNIPARIWTPYVQTCIYSKCEVVKTPEETLSKLQWESTGADVDIGSKKVKYWFILCSENDVEIENNGDTLEMHSKDSTTNPSKRLCMTKRRNEEKRYQIKHYNETCDTPATFSTATEVDSVIRVLQEEANGHRVYIDVILKPNSGFIFGVINFVDKFRYSQGFGYYVDHVDGSNLPNNPSCFNFSEVIDADIRAELYFGYLDTSQDVAQLITTELSARNVHAFCECSAVSDHEDANVGTSTVFKYSNHSISLLHAWEYCGDLNTIQICTIPKSSDALKTAVKTIGNIPARIWTAYEQKTCIYSKCEVVKTPEEALSKLQWESTGEDVNIIPKEVMMFRFDFCSEKIVTIRSYFMFLILRSRETTFVPSKRLCMNETDYFIQPYNTACHTPATLSTMSDVASILLVLWDEASNEEVYVDVIRKPNSKFVYHDFLEDDFLYKPGFGYYVDSIRDSEFTNYPSCFNFSEVFEADFVQKNIYAYLDTSGNVAQLIGTENNEEPDVHAFCECQ